MNEPAQHSDQTALAGSIGTQHPDGRPGAYVDREVRDGDPLAVSLAETADVDPPTFARAVMSCAVHRSQARSRWIAPTIAPPHQATTTPIPFPRTAERPESKS